MTTSEQFDERPSAIWTTDELKVMGGRVLGRRIDPDAPRHHVDPPIYLMDIAPDTPPAKAQGEQ